MLNVTTYYVDGFRSLRDFQISFRPGINCLVGPNGSGKSNFIEFLDFFSSLIDESAPVAVSTAGGLSRVFSHENLRKKSVPIKVEVAGIASFNKAKFKRFSPGYFKYHYQVELRFHKATSTLAIHKEALRFGRLKETATMAMSALWVGTISVKRPINKIESEVNWSFSKRLFSKSRQNPLNIPVRGGALRGIDQLKSDNPEEALGVPPDETFLSQYPIYSIPAIRAVKEAMSRGQSFHIMPDMARKPDDISSPAYIERNGRGLIATLFELEKLKKDGNTENYYFPSRVKRDAIDNIITFLRLVAPNISNLSVYADINTGTYNGYAYLEGSPTLRIPFNSLSDGTIKWLALLSLVKAFAGIYTFEEPENFLHPRMQQVLIEFMRDNVEDDSFDYFVISTHSESLINVCRPDELIIFSMVGWKTVCRRIQNPETVLEEINRTGFGLGHYYATNVLS